MNSRQFFRLNMILSSNIILFGGIVCFFIIGIIGSFPFFDKSYNFLWRVYYILILLFWISYILLKILVFQILTMKKFKKTFSYKILKRILKDYNFRRKVLCRAFVLDLIFNFFVLNIILITLFYWIGSIETSFVEYLVYDILINLFSFGGIFLSYLFYIWIYEIKNILTTKIM